MSLFFFSLERELASALTVVQVLHCEPIFCSLLTWNKQLSWKLLKSNIVKKLWPWENASVPPVELVTFTRTFSTWFTAERTPLSNWSSQCHPEYPQHFRLLFLHHEGKENYIYYDIYLPHQSKIFWRGLKKECTWISECIGKCERVPSVSWNCEKFLKEGKQTGSHL